MHQERGEAGFGVVVLNMGRSNRVSVYVIVKLRRTTVDDRNPELP